MSDGVGCRCCGQPATFFCVGCNAPCASDGCACSCAVATPMHPSKAPVFGLPSAKPAVPGKKALPPNVTENWRVLEAEQAGKWLETLRPDGLFTEADHKEAGRLARAQVGAWFRWRRQAEQRGIV